MQFVYNNQRLFSFFYVIISNDVDICSLKTSKFMTKKLNIKILSIIHCLVISSISFAQDIISVTIPWEMPKEILFKGDKLIIPTIKDQDYNFNSPNFYWQQKINSKNISSLVLSSYELSDALSEEVKYLKSQSIVVPKLIDIDLKITKGGKDAFTVVNLFPFVNENGVIKRVTSLKMKTETLPSQQYKSKEKSFAASSVLADGSGVWYKIGVRTDGVCKIDKSFLEACGISTTNLNPQSINVFGNGDGKLPELNSIPRTDDLAKNAIYVKGESDGVFDENDYILFYAWGPSRWYQNDTVFYQDYNIYSDVSFYYININPNDTPLRISSINSSLTPVTHSVTSYSYFDKYEKDSVNLVSGGQRWYGDLFDTDLSKIFSFSIPNIVSSSPVVFEVSLASNSSSTAGTSQKYRVNGVTQFDTTLPAGDYGRSVVSFSLNNPNSSIPLEISITRNSPSVFTFLDKITLNARRNLVLSSSQFNFRDLNSVGVSNVADFSISNVSSTFFCWDITDRHIPKLINGELSGSVYNFQLEVDSLREFVASNGLNFFTPEKIGFVANQNLHALPQADYLIVTHPSFIEQANRLANLHIAEGLTVHVVTTNQIYNEFSSGMLDPTAIRSFGKMFYDRAASDPSTMPKYLLLFGDGTFDPKNRVENNNNYVPTYQVLNSEDHIKAMVTDDYFGLYDDDDAIDQSDLLDIGVGRLLISDNTIAKQQVDKIEHYMKNGSSLYGSSSGDFCGTTNFASTFGDWRLKNVMISDDEENNWFIVNDSEPNSQYVKENYPEINGDKIYLDAYVQTTTAGGQRYPDVNNAITDRIERGALIVNYVGHGGEVGVAEERVITIPQIQDWNNINTMNLMMTATCEFTKYDDPSRVSAGEWVSLNPYGGSIALMTTTRSVYFNVNTATGKRFYENVYLRDVNNKSLAFGEIIKNTKNAVGSSDNKRSFTLIGDPALRIALPEMRIVTDSINGLSPVTQMDTIRALSKMTVKGHIENYSSNLISDFSGVISPTVFDKPKIQSTLGQDSDSPIVSFDLQKNALYKGNATVTNGYFEFSFIVPKDINYSFGNGKISYYANNGVYDAAGQDTMLIIGGADPVGIQDETGPEITMFLNDSSFVNTGITDETPILKARFYDVNGINTVGNGVGHDILAVLDGNTANPIVLNEYYSANLNTYQSGTLSYDFTTLEKGSHTLTLKVWDVNNNSSEATIDFIVQEKEEIKLDHVLNYPNPFTTKTEFFFEHNQVCSNLEAQVQIFTVSGKLVKTINENVLTNGFRSTGIAWDGLDDYGDQLAKGVYIYRLIVKTNEGKMAEKTEKLVILK